MEQLPPPVVNGIGNLEEPVVLQPVRVRDTGEFEQLMRLHNQRLYRLAFSLLGDESEAEDVLQESYVRAFQRLSSFAGRSSIGTWLASIVRHSAIDHLRSRLARQAAYALESDLREIDGEPHRVLDRAPVDAPQSNPEISLARDELRLRLESAIDSLPVQFRAVFMLREIEGLSVQETAEFLGVPVATVKTRDHRARLLLRATLGDEDYAPSIRQVFPFLGVRCDRIVAGVRARLQL